MVDGAALVVAGTGRYADPWHRYRECARCLADVLAAQGVPARIRTDPDRALRAIGDDVSLLAILVGEPADDGRPAPLPEARRGLDAYLDSGRPVLAMHSAASAFPGYERWEQVVGARWVAGTTWHPPLGWGRVEVPADAASPAAPAVDGGFDVYDELYVDLRLAREVVPWATHEVAGRPHPLVWCTEAGTAGTDAGTGTPAGRAVYDALGHDARSYGSPGHVRLLARATEWLLGADGGGR